MDEKLKAAVASLTLDTTGEEGRMILGLVAAKRLKADYVFGLVNGLQAGLRALGGSEVVGSEPFDKLKVFEEAARLKPAKLQALLSKSAQEVA